MDRKECWLESSTYKNRTWRARTAELEHICSRIVGGSHSLGGVFLQSATLLPASELAATRITAILELGATGRSRPSVPEAASNHATSTDPCTLHAQTGQDAQSRIRHEFQRKCPPRLATACLEPSRPGFWKQLDKVRRGRPTFGALVVVRVRCIRWACQRGHRELEGDRRSWWPG